MESAVQSYVDAIPAAHRALFDRIQRLILEGAPNAQVTLSYGMPTYVTGKRRLHLGVWSHGVSLYGWKRDRDGGFLSRHPDLDNGKGTIRLTPEAALHITDEEVRDLARATLSE
jgi:uncharacterized protein YdhG (YjbR/CyaY superfamily)